MSLIVSLLLSAAAQPTAPLGLYSAAVPFPEPTVLQDAPAEAEPEKDPFLGHVWSGALSAGLTIVGGNSRSTTASVDTTLEGRGESDRVTLKGGYIGSRQRDNNTGQDNTTARRIFGSAKLDYFITEKLFAYLLGTAERDDIRFLDSLVHVGAGLGYQWIEKEERNLFTELGLGYTDENYSVNTSDVNYWAGRAALHYDTKISETAEFFHDSSWIPSLASFDKDHIVHTVTGIRSNIFENFALEAKVIFDWDSSPVRGNKEQDVIYIAGVTYNF